MWRISSFPFFSLRPSLQGGVESIMTVAHAPYSSKWLAAVGIKRITISSVTTYHSCYWFSRLVMKPFS